MSDPSHRCISSTMYITIFATCYFTSLSSLIHVKSFGTHLVLHSSAKNCETRRSLVADEQMSISLPFHSYSLVLIGLCRQWTRNVISMCSVSVHRWCRRSTRKNKRNTKEGKNLKKVLKEIVPKRKESTTTQLNERQKLWWEKRNEMKRRKTSKWKTKSTKARALHKMKGIICCSCNIYLRKRLGATWTE